MRKLKYIGLVAAIGGVTSFGAIAHAQTEGADVIAQQPNVLLLVDTSGSMEWKSSGDVSPVCDPTNVNTSTTSPNEKSRWIELVETLTGSIDSYSCYSEKRDATTNFPTEFQLQNSTNPPYDLGYLDSYHRPMSNLCAPGPGVLPTTPYAYSPIAYRPFIGGGINLTGAACATPFSQQRDGLLDSFSGLLRFGLMTFDSHPDPGTGVISGISDYQNGLQGTWSYYLNSPSRCARVGGTAECKTGTAADPVGCCVGTPATCTTPAAFEVGARNAAAPPWEGRMVAFGPSTEDGTLRNQQIQEILLATRPYGATPIAGMLDDARSFMWYDTTADPLNSGQFFGPIKDPLVTATCRPNYIILLTDGAPNTDLRPSCENGSSSAMCPYAKPEDIANDLVTSTTNPQVRTFVVGFALSSVTTSTGTPIDCQSMDLSLCTPTPTDAALKACCTLNNIAFNGTPVSLRGKPPSAVGVPADDHAVFPKNPTELRSALSRVFQTLLKQVTGRTSPVTSGVSSSDKSGAAGYQFTSGAKVLPTGLWSAVLNRQRVTCDSSLNSQIQAVDVTKGDDFIANLTKDPTASDRVIFTVQPDTIGTTTVRQPTWSMRPLLEGTVNDGVGHYKGTQTSYDSPSNLANDISPESLKITTGATGTCGDATVTANACRTRLVEWLVGLPSAKPVSRCPQVGAADCSIVGDIFHSLPQLRTGQPNEFIQDATYTQYSADLFKRDSVLYTSSNDGFFHAFRVAPGDPTDTTHQVTSNKNNEEWSFLAPAVLPLVHNMYPGGTAPALNRIPALDGVPVIKDVAVTVNGTRALSSTYPYRFERQKAPNSTQGESFSYRTIAVQSYGSKQPAAYFALDITKPTIDNANLTTTGPKFLWQMSTDDNGTSFLGRGGATPLITSVYMNLPGESSSTPPRLVSVAVLPGGVGDPPASPGTATCNATNDVKTALPYKVGTVFGSTSTSNPPYRTKIRCYDSTSSSIASRSLTIVKLDTGEVVRTFRPTGAIPAGAFGTGAASLVSDYTFDPTSSSANPSKITLDIDAPIVGQPVAYPSGTGLAADRFYVGDAEGRLWRIDVSNPDTTKWAMNLFYDPYKDAQPLGQPVQTPPVLSVDDNGQITVAFSTGDQDNLTPDPNPATPVTYNYVVSLSEAVLPSSGVTNFATQVNWRQEYTGGKRVLGPMTLFNKTLYFSTFLQSISTSCNDIGTSSVWGLDYIAPNASANGGKVNLTTIDYPNVVISGVGLRQRPSCSTASSTGSSLSTDAFLGYGNITSVQTTNVGSFELVIQKGGSKASTTSTGTGSSSNTIATDSITLPTPKATVRLDSWAPIIE